MRVVGEPVAADESGPLAESETDRLRRHLRALAAVNRQLYAQVEGTGVVRVAAPGAEGDLLAEDITRGPSVSVRRLGPAAEMADRLATTTTGGTPFLVRDSARTAWVVEGRVRRPIKARMLFDALAGAFEERTLPDREIQRLDEGVPVEVFEGPSGPAFVVVGGRAYPLRGLPLPYPVSDEMMARFPKGPELRVRAGGIATTSGLRAAAGRVRRALRRR